MQGRIFSIKKTTILRSSFIISFLLYVTSLIMSFTIFHIDNYWFFSFCFFIGLHLIVKNMLFAHDSSCFFGVILSLTGGFYFWCFYWGVLQLYLVFVLLSFSFGSFATFVFFKQPFQLLMSLSLFFASIITFIFILNIISSPIFLALLVGNVLLLVGAYFWLL